MRKTIFILQTTFMIIFCIACGTSVTKTPQVSVPVCANDGLTMSSFLAITPGLTSETDIESILGVADVPHEPLLTEWIWGYLCETGSDVELHITVDTIKIPFIVKRMNYYNPQINIADLTNLFGLPEIVYKENNKDRFGEVTVYTFAYPSVGVFASVTPISIPVESDEVIELLKQKPQNLQRFIADLNNQESIEIVEWSNK